MKKGDPLQAARLAGIMAAKQTSALIPLCHPLPLSSVHVELTPTARGYNIEARVRTTAQTGVEMEALTAVAVAALTVYDMVKAVDKAMVIGDIALEYKAGGKSGTYIGERRSQIAKRRSQIARRERQCDRDVRSLLQSCILQSCHSMNVVIGVVVRPSLGPAATVRRSAAPRVSLAHLPRRLGPRGRCGACCPTPTWPLPRSSIAIWFRRSTTLRWVQAPAAGIGHLLSDELVASPIVLTSARGVRARAIAEHVMGDDHRPGAPAAARAAAPGRAPVGARRARVRRHGPDPCRAGGSRLSGSDRSASRSRGWRPRSACASRPCASTRARPCRTMSASTKSWPPDGLLELLSQTDVLVLSAPLTPETRSLIGRRGAGRHQARGAAHQCRARQAPRRRGGRRRSDGWPPRRRRARRLHARAARRGQPLLGSPERHRHPAHVGRHGGLLDPARGAVCREPAPVRGRPAAAERRRQAARVLRPRRRCTKPQSCIRGDLYWIAVCVPFSRLSP